MLSYVNQYKAFVENNSQKDAQQACIPVQPVGYIKISKKAFGLKHSVILSSNNISYELHNPTNSKQGLANGEDGIIKIARNMRTGDFCIVKIKKSPIEEEYENFENEFIIASMYRAKNGIDYQERDCENGIRKSYHFMLPSSGVSFRKFDVDALSKTKRLQLVYNLLLELSKLAILGIVHHDINDVNILIDDYLNVYFVDFAHSFHNDEYLVHGHDFEAVSELIIDYDRLKEYPVLEQAFKQKLKECGNHTNGYKYISIDDLLEQIKLVIMQAKTKLKFDGQIVDNQFCNKRKKCF